MPVVKFNTVGMIALTARCRIQFYLFNFVFFLLFYSVRDRLVDKIKKERKKSTCCKKVLKASYTIAFIVYTVRQWKVRVIGSDHWNYPQFVASLLRIVSSKREREKERERKITVEYSIIHTLARCSSQFGVCIFTMTLRLNHHYPRINLRSKRLSGIYTCNVI